MRSPAEYYIKYLLSDPTREIEDIDSELLELDIQVSIPYLVALKKTLRFPKNYSPLDRSHNPTREFLKKHKIWGLWYADAITREAVELYQAAGIRETICTALLSKLEPEMISEVVLKNHGISILPASIMEFKHYFWNTDLLTTEQMTELCASDKGPGNANYLAAMRAPIGHPAGTHLALYKLRSLPENIDRLDMYKSLKTIAYNNALDANAMLRQGRSKSEAIKNYSMVV